MRAYELEHEIGWVSSSSLRSSVASLREHGALARTRDAAGAPRTELTAAGRDLLTVADTLEFWFRRGPDRRGPPDDAAVRATIRVLNAGWNSTAIQRIAARPATLSELSARIPTVNYPTLKRRLVSLRTAGLVAPADGRRSRQYAVTEWMRRAVALLAVALRWELRHAPEGERMAALDAEAIFLLALPLQAIPPDAAGACTLGISTDRIRAELGAAPAGVDVAIEDGALASCVPAAGGEPSTWALGTAEAWLDAVIDGNEDGLKIQGLESELAAELVGGIHGTLFPHI